MKPNYLPVLLALLFAGAISTFASSAVDRRIEAAARSSYSYCTALEDHVTVSAGHIVLSGEAASEAEESLATKLAQDVRGVPGVSRMVTVVKN